MAKRVIKADEPAPKMRPGITPEARESQMIALAVNEAEYQMRNHTASAQVICHYLKLGTEATKLEREKLEKENQLLQAKTEALKSAKAIEDLYSKAITAMKSYSGVDDSENHEY